MEPLAEEEEETDRGLTVKLTTMLSNRRDQIVEGRTSIFRVTLRQKHPAVVRKSLGSIPREYFDIFVVAAVYYVYTGTTPHLLLFPLFLLSFPWTAGSDVGHCSRAEARGRRSFTHDGIPLNINLVAPESTCSARR